MAADRSRRAGRALLFSLLLLLTTSPARSGPNNDGVLLLHHNPSLVGSCSTDVCGRSELSSCDQALSKVETQDCAPFFVLAAFPSWRSPRLTEVAFGIAYDASRLSVGRPEPCADVEVADAGWPGSGTGTVVGWNAPQVSRLVEVYAFVGYAYDSAAQSFAVGPHPTRGGFFASDTDPHHPDPITDYGALGWFTDGRVPCPIETAPPGACCLDDETCVVVSAEECDALAGTFQDYGLACTPDLCVIPTGACCWDDDSCTVHSRADCATRGGEYRGDGTDCDPNPCPPPPPPTGACCFSESECLRLSQAACSSQGGQWTGAGTTCESGVCADGPGACCRDNGSCRIRTKSDCLDDGEIFLGVGMSCSPNPCTPQPGACCIDELGCQVLTPQACSAAGGRYRGRDVPCSPATCPPITGACCLPDGSCERRYQPVCEAAGGNYLGDGQACVAGACDLLEGCGPSAALRSIPPVGAAPLAAASNASTGPGHGVVSPETRGDEACGEFLIHTDESYEMGYAWQYGGTAAPFFGSFAECFEGNATICNVVLDLTATNFTSYRVDLYVWDTHGDCPGNVICVRPSVSPGAVAFWPAFSRHRLELPQCCVSGRWWVGYWGDWPNGGCDYFVGADLDGPGGCPKNCIAPGIGFPSGWQNVSLAWGPTQSIGIGADVLPCEPTPIRESSWGRIKSLFAR